MPGNDDDDTTTEQPKRVAEPSLWQRFLDWLKSLLP